MYIYLFICATTRSVYVKLVPDLSTEMFVLAFRRFLNNKGMPHTYITEQMFYLPSVPSWIKSV